MVRGFNLKPLSSCETTNLLNFLVFATQFYQHAEWYKKQRGI